MIMKVTFRAITSTTELYCTSKALPKSSSYYHHRGYAQSSNVKISLSEPSWSVKSLLPRKSEDESTRTVSREQLHHLMRLSALNLPQNEVEEDHILQGLDAHLNFVKDIQSVDTSDVKPLRNFHNESQATEHNREITIDSLREALENEELIGKHQSRIRKKLSTDKITNDAEALDVSKWPGISDGGFFVLDVVKETVEVDSDK